ncbi:MAG TPA: hypothetical protein VFN97_05195 [Actinospica sp.]|nr:hypothetical protein [Actinospica sp.]
MKVRGQRAFDNALKCAFTSSSSCTNEWNGSVVRIIDGTVSGNPVAMAGMFLFPLGTAIGYEFESPLAVVLSGTAMVGVGALIATWNRLRDPHRA